MIDPRLRMGFRNSFRRPSETALVVAGLMVATAILTGSLATSDSLAAGIRESAYLALGPTDVFVEVPGQLFFPQDVATALAANATVASAVHGISPVLLAPTTVSLPRTEQHDASVSIVGFDASSDSEFGDFHLTDGTVTDGSSLTNGSVYITSDIAAKIGAEAGDRLEVSYGKIPQPILPSVTNFTGKLVAASGPGSVPGPLGALLPAGSTSSTYVHSPEDQYRFNFRVHPDSEFIAVVARPLTTPPTELDLELRSPSGRDFLNDSGTVARPEVPAILVVNRSETGNWTLLVHSKAATNTPFEASVLVFYRIYDLQQFENFTRALRGPEAQAFRSLENGSGPGVGGPSFQEKNVTVAGVVTVEGKGGFLLQPDVFVPLPMAQFLYGQEGNVNAIKVSIDGDAHSGVARSDATVRLLDAALAAGAASHPDDPAYAHVQAVPVKARILAASDRAGATFREVLVAISSFTILAGGMLIVNIFVMLAEERRTELGLARAVGLRRRDLILLFVAEGGTYSLIAGLVGVATGLALSRALIQGFNSVLLAPSDRLFALPFAPSPLSVAEAFLGGLALSLATILIVTWRTSRLNIVRAIRRLDEPPRPGGRAARSFGMVLTSVGLAAGLAAGLFGDFILEIAGPSVAIVGAGLLASQRWNRRLVYILTGATLGTFLVASLLYFPTPAGVNNEIMAPIRAMLLVVAIAVILVQSSWIEKGVRNLVRRLPRWRAAGQPGIAYPFGKRMRTGLTLSIFALVVLIIVTFGVLNASFQPDVAAQKGGYDVEGTTTTPIGNLTAFYAAHGVVPPSGRNPLDEMASYDELEEVDTFGGNLVRVDNATPSYPGPPIDYLYAYAAPFVQSNHFTLEERARGYPTDAAAYQAVLDDPSLVIVSRTYLIDNEGAIHHVGSRLTVNTSSGPVPFTIIGVQEQQYLGGVFVNPQVLATNFHDVRGEYLFHVKPGVDARAAAQDLEAGFQKGGMDASSISDEVAKLQQRSSEFTDLFQIYLGFGLVVGIASLAIVTARNVLERRQEIGMLRAIGFSRRDVRNVFLLEVFSVVSLGLAVGVGTGLFLAWTVTQQYAVELDAHFAVPWENLGVLLAIVYAVTLAATFYPAWKAGRIPPAEAVRYVE
jgi:putative ABC transport system permease protein